MVMSAADRMDFRFQDFNDQFGSGVFAEWIYDESGEYFAESKLTEADTAEGWTVYNPSMFRGPIEVLKEKLANDYRNWCVNTRKDEPHAATV